jgi:hypothetical protein
MVVHLRIDHRWYCWFSIISILLYGRCFGRFLGTERKKSRGCDYRPIFMARNELAAHIFGYDIVRNLIDGKYCILDLNFNANLIIQSIFHVDLDNEGTQQSLWAYLYENGFHSWIPNAHLASLVFSLAHLLLWLGVAALCYFRKFFLKI